jgi:hypothetical protein
MIAAAPVAQNPAGVWRGFWLEEPGTATKEVKSGPYRLTGFADWAVVAPLPCIALWKHANASWRPPPLVRTKNSKL